MVAGTDLGVDREVHLVEVVQLLGANLGFRAWGLGFGV